MMYADIYPALPVEGPFTYKIPDGMNIEVGCRVKIPFGRKKVTGFVIGIHNNKPKEFEAKEVIENYDSSPIYDKKLINLVSYCADNYFSKKGEAFQKALPSGKSTKNRYKNPFSVEISDSRVLRESQQTVYNSIVDDIAVGKLMHLIYGVTGSGKTEVYIKIAEDFISRGESIIYLVPEITLSSQIYKRLLQVFGDSLIIYHSKLTSNQKLDNWIKFYNGEAKIVIGTRSSVFMQAPKLGLIIIDEEHDSSYKENSSPRYNARRLAVYRSKTENCAVLFGSATPSVETFFAAKQGVLQYHEMLERFGSVGFPEIELVELNDTKDNISTKLKLNIKKTLDSGNQVILLLNRRGYSPVIMCSDCKKRVECPHCSIGMNYHKSGSLICHYCGYTRAVPEICPDCGSKEIVKIGSGTQKIEEELKKYYPNANIRRLDQDTASKKDAVHNVVQDMESGEIDILIGTQMVSKGFDFKKVQTVGIILADIGLNMPDFRASERIFSLLTQVVGRSGRGDIPGKVIIQTLDQSNSIYKNIIQNNFFNFYESEIEIRRLLNYPPFARIVRLLVRGVDEDTVIKSANKIFEIVDSYVKKQKFNTLILGPAPAPFQKISRNYRHHILLKSNKIDEIRKITHHVNDQFKDKKVYLEIDIDPVDLL